MTRKRVRKEAPPALFWTDRALADLEDTGDYIARDDARAAERWVRRLMTSAEAAAKMPLAGRRVPDLARDDVREVFERTYRIVYRVTPGRVEILCAFEGHRLFPADLATPPSDAG